jgi:predicted ATPase
VKLSRAKIKNYKSFNDSGDIEFASGFNVFIGKNDAGKSALLEALSTHATYSPHRSLANAPSETVHNETSSVFFLTFAANAAELRAYFSSQSDHWLPVHIIDVSSVRADVTISLVDEAIKAGDELVSIWQTDHPDMPSAPTAGYLQTLSGLNHVSSHHRFANSDAPRGFSLSHTNTSGTGTYAASLARWLATGIYSFRAERLTLSRSSTNGSETLKSDASNLPEVLNILQTRHTHQWKEYLEHVKSIFPHITEVKAVLIQSGQVDILISTTDPALARSDLDVSLKDSGTGIGQALAILYVAVRNTRPQVILIDEPQSFLHPGALRKLLEILRQYDRHQYILTTHSPMSLSLSGSDKMFQIIRDPAGSKVIPIVERDDLYAALRDIGARPADVYGAEAILWVEGPTEERCFPEIVRGIAKKPLQGTAFIGVVTTGELEAKDARRVCEIYERLTQSSALLPKTVAFVFDREGRKEQGRNELTKRLRGLMHWLPLRLYENYLLCPDAIAHVLSAIRDPALPTVTTGQVEAWLKDNGGSKKYFEGHAPRLYGDAEWLIEVHGANVLDDLFYELTNDSGPHEYQKVKHGLLLTQYLIENPTQELRDLALMLSNLLDQSPG